MREVSPGDLVFSFFDIVAFLSTSDGLGIRFPGKCAPESASDKQGSCDEAKAV